MRGVTEEERYFLLSAGELIRPIEYDAFHPKAAYFDAMHDRLTRLGWLRVEHYSDGGSEWFLTDRGRMALRLAAAAEVFHG